MLHRWSRCVPVTAVGLALLLAGACGTGEKLTAREIVVGAATKTAAANSSKIALEVAISAATSPNGNATFTGRGAFDYDDHRGALKMTVPIGMSPVTLDIVTIGSTIYEKLPPQLAGSLGDKPWLKIDLADLSRLAGFDLSSLASSQSSDPSQALAFLRGASVAVAELGKTKLRGEEVTHYKFTVDVAKAAERAPESSRKALEAVAGLYAGQQIPMDVWVDNDGRLRKMTYAVDLAKLTLPPSATQPTTQPLSGSVTTTFELYDFGTKVDAEAPPPDQVTDIKNLLPG